MKCWQVILAVVVLPGTAVLHAEIIYCPTNFILGDVWVPQPDELFSLDVDANGTVDFSLAAGNYYFSGIHPECENKYLILPSLPPNIGGRVAALDSGYLIGSNSGESNPEEWFGSDNYSSFIRILDTGKYGEFYESHGYIGLEFESEDGTHYGWLEIEGRTHSSSIRIYGWAYESTPGANIFTGAIPEPSSALLALIGGMSVWFLRRQHRISKDWKES
ncbi:MAG: hypothetical protein JXR23_09095 [Pontiellaceae bacterium]|nr:hypothetical protein [Pontiellaceae bacterium]